MHACSAAPTSIHLRDQSAHLSKFKTSPPLLLNIASPGASCSSLQSDFIYELQLLT